MACSVTLIDDQWVLAPSSCFEDALKSKEPITVTLTAGWYEANKNQSRLITFKGAKVCNLILNLIIYKLQNNCIERSPFTMIQASPFTMVRLNQTLDFSGEFNYLEPMCLPTKNQSIDYYHCEAVLWADYCKLRSRYFY